LCNNLDTENTLASDLSNKIVSTPDKINFPKMLFDNAYWEFDLSCGGVKDGTANEYEDDDSWGTGKF
jgi:hypothetical protein